MLLEGHSFLLNSFPNRTLFNLFGVRGLNPGLWASWTSTLLLNHSSDSTLSKAHLALCGVQVQVAICCHSKVLIYLGFVLSNLNCAAQNSSRTTALSGQPGACSVPLGLLLFLNRSGPPCLMAQSSVYIAILDCVIHLAFLGRIPELGARSP